MEREKRNQIKEVKKTESHKNCDCKFVIALWLIAIVILSTAIICLLMKWVFHHFFTVNEML